MSKFEYVPAAITASRAHSYLAVNYGNNYESPDLWKRSRWNGVLTEQYPDRTLHFGTCSTSRNGILPHEADRLLLTSVSSQFSSLREMGYTFAMVSPLHVSKTSRTVRNPHVKLISDSGGFQLYSGASDYVNPEELAHLYNDTVDFGVGLDIPVFGYEHLLPRMIEIMLKNNKVIRRNLLPSVQLYDVCHGATLEERKAFLDRLLKEKEHGPRLAIGGIAQNNRNGGAGVTTVTGVINLLYTLDRTKGRYESYHVLGTTQLFWLMMYAVLIELMDVHLTADSTSYRLSTINNMLTCTRMEDKDIRLRAATLPKARVPHTNICACPYCASVKYPLHYVFTPQTNEMHSLQVMQNQWRLVRGEVKEFLAGRITAHALVKMVVQAESNRPYVAALEFAVDAAKQGFAKAYEKHRTTLESHTRGGGNSSLFGKNDKSADWKKAEARLRGIFDKYEEMHKTQLKAKPLPYTYNDDRLEKRKVNNMMVYPTYSSRVIKWCKKKGIEVIIGPSNLLKAKAELLASKTPKLYIAALPIIVDTCLPMLGYIKQDGAYVNTKALQWKGSKEVEIDAITWGKHVPTKLWLESIKHPNKHAHLHKLNAKETRDKFQNYRRMFCTYLPASFNEAMVDLDRDGKPLKKKGKKDE